VRVNAVLIAQLLDNLLDNALKYSEDAVDLKVRVYNGHMQILVQDSGPVIPEECRRTSLNLIPAAIGQENRARVWVWRCAALSCWPTAAASACGPPSRRQQLPGVPAFVG